MALTSPKQHDILDLLLITAQKIEAEAQKVEPNLRRMVLLSNTYDKYALKVEEPLYLDDSCPPSTTDGAFAAANQPPFEWYSSSSGDPDDWDPDDSSCSETEVPPAYSVYTSPDVTVSISEYCSSNDSSDDSDRDLLYYNAAGDFDKFGFPTFKILPHDIKIIKPSSIPQWSQSENLMVLGSRRVAEGGVQEADEGLRHSSRIKSEKGSAALSGIRIAERIDMPGVNTKRCRRQRQNRYISVKEKSIASRLLRAILVIFLDFL